MSDIPPRNDLDKAINSILTKLGLLDDAIELLVETATNLEVQINQINIYLEHERIRHNNDTNGDVVLDNPVSHIHYDSPRLKKRG